MKKKTFARVSLGVSLSLLAILGVACKNGGSSVSLDAYFQQVADVENKAYSSFATQGAALETPSDTSSGEALAAFLRNGLTITAAAERDYAGQLDNVSPPDEAADAHNNLIDALSRAAGAYERVASVVPDSMTISEYQNSSTYFSEEENATLRGLPAACEALQQVARDHDIAVDLGCV